MSAESTRRALLRGAAAAGLAAPVLAGCSDDGSGTSGDGGSGPSAATVPTSDVPVGGGTILKDEMVVVTQPSEGEFKAFSAVCTHQKCPVQEIRDGKIRCNCHGSEFAVEDGSVVTGPAKEPLASLSVTVEGGSVQVS